MALAGSDFTKTQVPIASERVNNSSTNTSALGLNWLFLATVLVLCAVGCKNEPESNRFAEQPKQSRRIVVASYALEYLTQRLVDDSISVEFPGSDASDPQEWEPSVEDIASMQRADLIVVNGRGAEFAKWLVRTTLSEKKICASCDDIPLGSLISVSDFRIVHSHGPEGEHSHAFMVPHTWLEPTVAAAQAKTIAERLADIYPGMKATIESNLSQLLVELDELESLLPDSESESIAIVSSSPELKYLTRAAGFSDLHLLWFDKLYKADSASTLKQLGKLVSDSQAVAVVCGGAPIKELETFCEETDIALVRVDLLEKQPATGDFLSSMRDNINRLLQLRDSGTR